MQVHRCMSHHHLPLQRQDTQLHSTHRQPRLEQQAQPNKPEPDCFRSLYVQLRGVRGVGARGARGRRGVVPPRRPLLRFQAAFTDGGVDASARYWVRSALLSRLHTRGAWTARAQWWHARR